MHVTRLVRGVDRWQHYWLLNACSDTILSVLVLSLSMKNNTKLQTFLFFFNISPLLDTWILTGLRSSQYSETDMDDNQLSVTTGTAEIWEAETAMTQQILSPSFTLSRLAFSCLLGFLARMSLSFRILAISLSNTSSSSSSLRKLSKHRIDCHIWLQMMSGLGGGACSYKEAQRNMEGAGNPFPPENSPQSALQQLKPLLCPSPCLLYSWQCLYDLGKSVFLWFQRLRCVGKCV